MVQWLNGNNNTDEDQGKEDDGDLVFCHNNHLVVRCIPVREAAQLNTWQQWRTKTANNKNNEQQQMTTNYNNWQWQSTTTTTVNDNGKDQQQRPITTTNNDDNKQRQ